ncbi:restriction endonuclease subunit S [Fictibacillus sp. B-59209]|uniref:restriction endonuclease subunit S n=1 Tax=Fictibacillus sp. B-59209 TaxID=3024873 RepID=UPI002E1E1C6E|nr:restriction endonuclease subunit S [Fictibacillus sp. B-59209]
MKSKLKPEVRFPGFTGDWEQQKIGEYLKESRIPGTNGLKAKKLTVKLWGKGVVPKEEVYKGSESTKYYIRKSGQFIYGKLDFLHQAFGIIPDKLDGYESTLDSPAFDIADNLDPLFFHEYVSRKQFYIYQGTLANGSRKAKRIHSETFLEMPLLVPTEEEQTNLGIFFKNLDDTIALQQQELTTLKQTKQGFLQKMFPKEGESVPEVRFPGFSGDWVEKELKEISIRITKGTTPADKSWEGTIKYIKTDSINSINGNIENTSRISKKEHESNLKRSKLKINDILFSIVGTLGRVGIVKEKDLPANTNQQICIIRLSEGDINFILMALKTPSIEKFIKSDATIGAQPSISLWQMEALKVPYPQIDEQQKIGNFFKQLDDTIALYQRELDALKETKKAFLQKMFA